jgi:hypothetical protein
MVRPVSPVLTALCADLALPTSVTGPVESAALARFAMICASDDILAPGNGNATLAREGGAAFQGARSAP